ncbi:MAG: T9SS type A sorting domain-containing protein [Candidatus Cloacimonetes bacterium]|nr:T9SS type A sorting domain-containing protein [Candidatus Cloacimonadota bacterium]
MNKIYFILALFVLPLFLFSQTHWYVDASATSPFYGTQADPFAEISDAVDALDDGDIVHVAAGTYRETVNFVDHYFDLMGTDASTTIIDGNGTYDGIIVPTTGAAITGVSTIKGFLITDSDPGENSNGGGIHITNRNVKIMSCDIFDNDIPGDGGGIYFFGDDDTNTYKLEITSTDIRGNACDGDGGGIYFYSEESDVLDIDDCNIYENECLYLGGGVFTSGDFGDLMSLSFQNSSIYGNVSTSNNANNSKGGGIYAAYLDYRNLTFEHLLVFENISYDHGSGIAIANSDGADTDNRIIFNNLTVVDNECDVASGNPGFYFESCSFTKVINTILWSNESSNGVGSQVSQGPVEYCCVEGGYAGDTNIDDDPDFMDAAGDDYSLEDFSLCIDMGDVDSSYDDPDDSRADMGYEYVDQDEFEFSGFGTPTTPIWHWLSYPRLPVSTSTNTGQNVDTEFVRHHWNTMPTECGWYYEDVEFLNGTYSSPDWTWDPTTTTNFESKKGYKVYRKGSASQHYSPGKKCLDGTDITISTGENWIGYFLEDSQKPSEAFPSAVLDDLDEVKTQTWTWGRDEYDEWEEDVYTINYGDCVIVDATDNNTFDWEAASRSEPIIRPEPQQFTYVEEIDYQPIYVDFGENDLPLEIAVYVDDECRGAEVVDGQITQICAYILECDPGLQVEFEFYYDNRQFGDRVRIYDIETASGMEKNTNLTTGMPGDRYFISFRDIDFEVPEPPIALHCYPNPFNPELTISFNVDETQEVDLVIYNSKGQKVKTMVNELFRPADYSLVWNGKDDSNHSVSSGVYFIRLQIGDDIVNDKVILMK